VERPPAQVGENAPREVDVVGDEVALAEPAGREEDLVGIRDRGQAHSLRSHPMRKALVLLAALAVAPAAHAANCPTVRDGKLTVGTDNPAYPPWFGGDPPKGSSWKVSDPASGKGYESAVAYAVAKQLGYKPAQVQWTY